MRTSTLVLTLATLGLLAIAAADALFQPPLVEIVHLDEHEGSRVRVEGRLARPARGLPLLQDAEGRVPVFLDRKFDFESGAEVTVVGLVSRAGGSYAIDVQRAEAREQAPYLDTCGVTREAPRFAGTPIAVEGNLAREEDAWGLTGGRCRLTLSGRPAQAEAGETGVARGILAYDSRGATYQLEVAAWSPRLN